MAPTDERDEALAQQALGLLELSSLNADDTPARIVALCERALTPVGPLAALCVSAKHAGLVRRTLDALRARDVRVVAVMNVPGGSPSIATIESLTQAALLAGADDIDLVYPFHAHLRGDRQVGKELIAACKTECARRATLTVTLETGVLRDPQIIRDVCRLTIGEGAAFIKTGTGKHTGNATPQAVRIMLEAIAETGGQTGIKVAGVRTLDEAKVYMEMARMRFGARWIESGRLRLGAASLLDDLLMRLGVRL